MDALGAKILSMREQGFKIYLENDELIVAPPASKDLSEAQKAWLKANKAQMISALGEVEAEKYRNRPLESSVLSMLGEHAAVSLDVLMTMLPPHWEKVDVACAVCSLEQYGKAKILYALDNGLPEDAIVGLHTQDAFGRVQCISCSGCKAMNGKHRPRDWRRCEEYRHNGKLLAENEVVARVKQ